MSIQTCRGVVAVAAVLVACSAVGANVVVNYTVDAGGSNSNPLNGLSASAAWRTDGTELTITVTNSSTGVPIGAEVSDSLLVSLAFNLGNGLFIVSGDSAVIGPGSTGVGSWSGLLEDDTVADEWLWTNDAGGDLLETFSQVISTSMGQGGGSTVSFNGVADPNVDGPFGGIAANPVLVAVPMNQPAVSNSIVFTMTLSDVLSQSQLERIAGGSIVEFGSDYQYLGVPAPGVLCLLAVASLLGAPRRRQAAGFSSSLS